MGSTDHAYIQYVTNPDGKQYVLCGSEAQDPGYQRVLSAEDRGSPKDDGPPRGHYQSSRLHHGFLETTGTNNYNQGVQQAADTGSAKQTHIATEVAASSGGGGNDTRPRQHAALDTKYEQQAGEFNQQSTIAGRQFVSQATRIIKDEPQKGEFNPQSSITGKQIAPRVSLANQDAQQDNIEPTEPTRNGLTRDQQTPEEKQIAHELKHLEQRQQQLVVYYQQQDESPTTSARRSNPQDSEGGVQRTHAMSTDSVTRRSSQHSARASAGATAGTICAHSVGWHRYSTAIP